MWCPESHSGGVIRVVQIFLSGETIGSSKRIGALISRPIAGVSICALIMLSIACGSNAKKEFLKSIKRGDVEATKSFLAEGMSPNARDRWDHYTALMTASNYGHVEIVSILLDSGADIDGRNRNGNTSLMQAASSGHADVVRFLLAKGADVNAKSEDDDTALMYAVWDGHIEIVKILLDRDADVNAEDNKGKSALMLAGMKRHKDIVAMLKQAGATE